jgi:transportin-3
MAANGVGAESFAPVLAALASLQGNVERSQKAQANDFLEEFQKSVSTQRA